MISDEIVFGIGVEGYSTPLQVTKPIRMRLHDTREIITTLLVSDCCPMNMIGADILADLLTDTQLIQIASVLFNSKTRPGP